MSYISIDKQSKKKKLWIEPQTDMKITNTYQTTRDIPPEVKAILNHFNAKPTPGMWSSFGYYWYTFMYNTKEYVMCIAKDVIPEHKDIIWEYAKKKWTISHDMFMKTKEEQEKLNNLYKDCELLNDINDFINQNIDKLVDMPTAILSSKKPNPIISYNI